jgi:tRNA 5-methylaminomethyl-2-thiouridine biosynthesis bifunctional protein
MGIRGTWGTRGDFSSLLDLKVSMHQSMSVGANVGGIIKLGATHEKTVKEPIACSDTQALSLQEKASSMIDTSDLSLEKTYCGMRAGSKDYFPLVGRVIDVPYMLETYPAIVRGAKPELQYVDNLYVLNGLGGRGFVFAPLMAKLLAEHIIEDKALDKRVNPDRLFLKWCRKL